MLTVNKIERVSAHNKEPMAFYHCPKCKNKVAKHHRYCWFCGNKLKHQDEEGDAYEIHHSGEPQLQGLLTYGKDAQLIEPRTR